MEYSADLYADVRVHTATATSKYLHENVVLAAVEEILAAQATSRSPVAYLGAFMTTLEAQGDTDPAVYAGIMTLLDRALAHVPRAVLLSQGPRIASALVGVANRHAEHALVLRGALSCVLRLLVAQPAGAPITADTLKLFRWLLEFVVHPSPLVRSRGQQVCTSAIERTPALSDAAARFVEECLTAAVLRDVEPALFVLNFVRATLGALEPRPLLTAIHAVLRLPSLGHPMLCRGATQVLADVCSDASSHGIIPASALAAIVDTLLVVRPGLPLLVEASSVRACVAAAGALFGAEPAECHARLPALVTAFVRVLRRQHIGGGGEGAGGGGGGEGGAAGGGAAAHNGTGAAPNGSDGEGGGSAPEGPLAASELCKLLDATCRPSMPPEAAGALRWALVGALGPRFGQLCEAVLKMCACYYRGLGEAASPAGDALLDTLAALYADETLGAARPLLLSTLGAAAEAIGPERFIERLPIRVTADEGSTDTSWLLAALRHHIGHARLAFFGSYFLPLAQWLDGQATKLGADGRLNEARHLRNLFEQVWALITSAYLCLPMITSAYL